MTATALTLLLMSATSAGAADWSHTRVVDQANGPYRTIGAAVAAADYGDTIDVHAGTYVESVLIDKYNVTVHGEPGARIQAPADASWAVVVAQSNVTLDGFDIVGTGAGVDLTYSEDALVDSTVTAPNIGVAADGPFPFRIDHSIVHAWAPSGRAIVASSQDTPGFPQRLDVLGSLVVGGHDGTGLDLHAGPMADPSYHDDGGGVAVSLSQTTVAGAANALRSAAVPGSSTSARAYDSIVHGTAPGLDYWRTERTASDAATFLNPAGMNYHLRAGAPAIGFSDGNPKPSDTPNPELTDLSGVPRSGDGNAPGAYEYVKPQATVPVSVPPVVVDPPKVAPRDVVAPSLSVSTAQTRRTTVRRRVHGATRRVVLVGARFAGHVGDAGGVARVQLVLRQATRRTGTCRFFDAARRAVVTRSCATTKAPVVNATLHGSAWRWQTPSGTALPKGGWRLEVRAIDRAGNATTKVMHFTVT